MREKVLICVIGIICGLVLIGCHGPSFSEGTIVVKGKGIMVEIASTNAARKQGLMNRKKLEPDRGMLFVFATEDYHGFWMKNTLIPLSIAFIKADGTISRIREMYPRDEEAIWSSEPVKYALEMNQGWFDRNNIKVGDKVFFPDAVKNIKAE